MNPIIQMVDLTAQYARLSVEIDKAIKDCLVSGQFIGGKIVSDFEQELASFTESKYVISCGNGTDALQLACMALGFGEKDEVIVPAFNYVAAAEVLKLLKLRPVFCDVSALDFMPTAEQLEKVRTPRTKALILTHLFGQCTDMQSIMEWAEENGILIIEDNAQSIGAEYQFPDRKSQAGTIGMIGTTSFFPSKNLGAYGDGGAVFTQDETLATKIRMMANHGQPQKYVHEMVGINSRLDAVQAAILRVKLKYLPTFISNRQAAAQAYDERLAGEELLQIPLRNTHSTHVFHQYTIRLDVEVNRADLQSFLQENGIPTAVYYPQPLYRQKAYLDNSISAQDFPQTELLTKTVLSLPMHTELSESQIDYICERLKQYLHG